MRAINEFIASLINKRGENLFEGIKNLLNDPTFTGLAQNLYNHGLVDGISQASKDPNKPNRHPSYMPSKTFALALLDILSSQSAGESWKEIAQQRKMELAVAKARLDADPGDRELKRSFDDAQFALEKAEDILASLDAAKKAYEEAKWAAEIVTGPKDVRNLKTAREKQEKALMLGRMLAADLPNQLENIQRTVSILPDGHSKQSLLVLINKSKQAALLLNQTNTAAQELEILQNNIEQWFNDAMDRVGGWYKRWSQRVLLAIAAVLVLVGNIDTFMLAERFSRDNALRSSIVAAAANAVQSNAGDPSQNASARDELLRGAESLTLPLGWISNPEDPFSEEQIPNCSDVPLSECALNLGLKALGLSVTAVLPSSSLTWPDRYHRDSPLPRYDSGIPPRPHLHKDRYAHPHAGWNLGNAARDRDKD